MNKGIDNITLLLPRKLHETFLKGFIEDHYPNISGYTFNRLLAIVHTISSHISKDEDDKYRGWSPLVMKYLRERVPRADLYIKYLIQHKIIERDNYYIVREKAYKYRFTDEYLSQLIFIEINDSYLKNRFKISNRNQIKRNSRKYPELNKWIYGLTIDKDSAIKFILSEHIKGLRAGKDITELTYKFNSYIGSIHRIHNKEFHISVNSTNGRYDTNLTNLKKELRQFLLYEGKPLISIDIKNSQPYFLSLIINNSPFLKNFYVLSSIMMPETLQYTENEDAKRCLLLLKEGQFYEYLMTEFNRAGMNFKTRDEVKREVLKIFFSGNQFIGQPEAKSKRIFKEKFPTVYSLIAFIKKHKKNRLANLLTRIESYLILNIISNRISKEFPNLPIFTIHDSISTTDGCILTTRENWELVENIMLSELKRYVGFPPILKIEKILKKAFFKKFTHSLNISTIKENILIKMFPPVEEYKQVLPTLMMPDSL